MHVLLDAGRVLLSMVDAIVCFWFCKFCGDGCEALPICVHCACAYVRLYSCWGVRSSWL